MWPFGISATKPYSQMVYCSELFSCFYIDLADFDIALLPKEIAASIFEIQGWVATAHAKVDVDRVAPFSIGIVGIYIEMFARGEYRRYHIETTFVVTYSWGIDACLFIHSLDSYLRFACKTGTNLLPVNQVFTVEYWYSRIILERTVYQIEVIA
jgi:hypothetical protein